MKHYYVRLKNGTWFVKKYKSIHQAKLTENANRTIERIRPATQQEIEYYENQKGLVTI